MFPYTRYRDFAFRGWGPKTRGWGPSFMRWALRSDHAVDGNRCASSFVVGEHEDGLVVARRVGVDRARVRRTQEGRKHVDAEHVERCLVPDLIAGDFGLPGNRQQ